jgi:acyl-CoA thioesterase-2
MTAVAGGQEAFELEDAGPGRFLALNIGDPERHDVVFGGQIIAQAVLASARAVGTASAKVVVSVHTVFARAASLRSPLEIDVDTMHEGRTVGSDTVTVRQGERLCARVLVLRQAPARDLVRHQDEMPPAAAAAAAAGPGAAAANSHADGLVAPGTEVRVAGGVDTWDPAAPTGPAELNVWVRLPQWAGGEALPKALLAYATDGFLIGTAMRPHAGIGQDMAHSSLATGVLTHTLSFHEVVPAAEWLLLAHSSSYAGRGRCYGRAHVYREGGQLIASFVQESLLRGNR